MILPDTTHHFTLTKDEWDEYPGDVASLCRIIEARLARQTNGATWNIKFTVGRSSTLSLAVKGPFGTDRRLIDDTIRTVLLTVVPPAPETSAI